jgi:PAS domain S-box-containing protein
VTLDLVAQGVSAATADRARLQARPGESQPNDSSSFGALSRPLRPRRESGRQRRDFLASVASPAGFEVLFDYLPDVYFFVKDDAGRFMRCNRAFANLLCACSEEEVLGLRDADFFPSALADNYVRDDHLVMASASDIVDKVELVRTADGSMNWYSTTKLPLLDANNAVIGVAGITRDISKMKSNSERFSYWAPVLETITANYADAIPMATLAAKVSLSVSQFDRRFKKHFRTTPRKYLTDVRINAACQLLSSSNLSVATIAVQTGFYDQSHFTKQFTKLKGTTPAQYRRNHGRNPPGEP